MYEVARVKASELRGLTETIMRYQRLNYYNGLLSEEELRSRLVAIMGLQPNTMSIDQFVREMIVFARERDNRISQLDILSIALYGGYLNKPPRDYVAEKYDGDLDLAVFAKGTEDDLRLSRIEIIFNEEKITLVFVDSQRRKFYSSFNFTPQNVAYFQRVFPANYPRCTDNILVTIAYIDEIEKCDSFRALPKPSPGELRYCRAKYSGVLLYGEDIFSRQINYLRGGDLERDYSYFRAVDMFGEAVKFAGNSNFPAAYFRLHEVKLIIYNLLTEKKNNLDLKMSNLWRLNTDPSQITARQGFEIFNQTRTELSNLGHTINIPVAVTPMLSWQDFVICATRQRTNYLGKDLEILQHNLIQFVYFILGIEKESSLTKGEMIRLWEFFDSLTPLAKRDFSRTAWLVCADICRKIASRKIALGLELQPPLATDPCNLVVATANGLDFFVNFVEQDGELRIQSITLNSAGAPICIARNLQQLGARIILVGTRGRGDIGEIFTAILKKQGLDTNGLITTEADTPFHLYFTLASEGIEHRFVPPGAELMVSEMETLKIDVRKTLEGNNVSTMVTSSRPPYAAPLTFLPEIIQLGKNRGVRVLYDTKLDVIRTPGVNEAILASGPYIIKPNLPEFAAMIGSKESTLRQDVSIIINEARKLIRENGIRAALVSMDRDGAVYITENDAYLVSVPKSEVKNAVGCGDVLIASWVAHLTIPRSDETDLIAGLKFAAGAATAATLSEGNFMPTSEEINQVIDNITVTKIIRDMSLNQCPD